jgi:hypothetical protein
MVRKLLGSLFGNGPTGNAVAEQRFVGVDEQAGELASCEIGLNTLRQMLRANGAELPTLAYSQFRQIDDLLATLTVYLQESGASVEQTVLLCAMVSDYLPTSLSTYLKLAKSVRHEDSPESAALFAQLAILHATAENLDKQVRSGAATELAVHGRFLQDKFDLSSLHLEGS